MVKASTSKSPSGGIKKTNAASGKAKVSTTPKTTQAASKSSKNPGDAAEVDASPAKTNSKRKTAADFLEEPQAAESTQKKAKTTAAQSGSSGLKSALKTAPSKVTVEASVTDKSQTVKNTKQNEKVPAPSSVKAKNMKSTKETTKAKAATTKKVTAEEAEEEDMEASDSDNEEDFIHGFSSSSGSEDESDGDEDSDVDMESGEGKSGAEVVKARSLPSVLKDDKAVAKRLEAAKKKNESERGVIYLGRIPHGFYEDEMRGYFSQFGDITRLRLARNKTTGASKHFAYIEFASKSVAEITAETMHNYLLRGHLLQSAVVPPEKLHPDLWVGANRKWRRVPAARVERARYGKSRTVEQNAKADQKLVKRDEERKKKIKDLGIDYDYKGFSLPK